MAVRGPDRPKDPELGTTLRHSRAPVQFLSVTVSIGLAERTAQDSTPSMVIHAADAALYRAKHAGRIASANKAVEPLQALQSRLRHCGVWRWPHLAPPRSA